MSMNRKQRRKAERELKNAQNKARRAGETPIGWSDAENLLNLGVEWFGMADKSVKMLEDVWPAVENKEYVETIVKGIASDTEVLSGELLQLKENLDKVRYDENGKEVPVDIDSIGNVLEFFEAADTWRIRTESILQPLLNQANDAYLKAGMVLEEAERQAKEAEAKNQVQ